MRDPGLFVTGTGTGVGKTFVATALVAAMRETGMDVGVMKPVETGCADGPEGSPQPGDALRLLAASGAGDALSLVCPYALRAPVAPAAAAALEGTEVSLARVRSCYRRLRRKHDWMVVEGAGGLAVPVSSRSLASDLVRALELPLLVVALSGLGTINHTLLTLQFAREAGLRVLGVVLNRFPAVPGLAETSAAELIEHWGRVPVLARVPVLRRRSTGPGRLAVSPGAGLLAALRSLDPAAALGPGQGNRNGGRELCSVADRRPL